jgi:uncharacterized membrane protein YbhN (UPF0104 family)
MNMRRYTLLSLAIVLVAVVVLAIPCVILVGASSMVEDYYMKCWGYVPKGYQTVVRIVTWKRLIMLCSTVCGTMVALEWRLGSEKSRLVAQIVCLSVWVIVAASCVLYVTYPYFVDIGVPVMNPTMSAP